MRTFMLALITGLLALLLTVTAAQAQPLTDLERALILQELMRRSALQPAPPIQWLPPAPPPLIIPRQQPMAPEPLLPSPPPSYSCRPGLFGEGMTCVPR